MASGSFRSGRGGKILDETNKYSKNRDKFSFLGEEWLLQELPDSKKKYRFLGYTVTIIAFFLRFINLNYPREVIFDEVHFGKFSSYYLERTFFFDVHPPFGKMLIAFVGWLINYDGKFKFDEIGHNYENTGVPYVAYRSLSAILGTLTVPIVFSTLRELNFKAITCGLASMLIAVDNAHIIDSRLILLDAPLIFFVALSIYSYVCFYKVQLRSPFCFKWYYWLYLTGFSLSFVLSIKYVGLFTFAMIGTGVVVNLWQLLDARAGLKLKTVFKHLIQRFNGLVFFPFLVYLFWFYVHFAILSKSGPGDSFMSSEFQQSLEDSPLVIDSRIVNYYDVITIKHKDTDGMLHSHFDRYPLRYEDGRVSSQGQQVTAYLHDDHNNNWEILPARELSSRENHPVLLDDTIRLRHVITNSYLLAHNVASPLYPTNEEITTVSEEEANGARYSETIFRLQPPNKKDTGYYVRTKNTNFRIIHVDTNVALWTHNDEYLPEWGFNQQEVNGNKKIIEPSNVWVVDKITNLPEERNSYIPKKVQKVPFFSKWLELQMLMFEHNNKLSSSHPFASQPESWPGSLSGVSFWTKDSERKQIYFTGNIIGWWFQIISLALYIGVVFTDLLTRQRNFFLLGRISRDKLYGPISFLFLGWCFHYFPFFLMARQKFLHHYLSAHLIAALFSGALWELLLSETKSLNFNKDESDPSLPYKKTPKVYNLCLTLLFVLVTISTAYFLYFYSPIVYGNRSLTSSEVLRRQWFNINLHFAK